MTALPALTASAGGGGDLGAAVDALRGVDVAFPALHGRYGEDGTIQSMLAYVGVPFVGNGVLASTTGMDKDHTKRLLAADGLRVCPDVGAAGAARTTCRPPAGAGSACRCS
jgi:D-alanine-D-alanine ligase-like ATP-grasp enzyme